MCKFESNRPGALFALVVVAVLFAAPVAPAQSWGTVKGQVVWAGKGDVPTPIKITVDKDQGHCLSKGDIYKNEIVVNPKNKGVRWALVWLADAESAKNTAWKWPVHPSLKTPKPSVEIDQPCCVFEPRMIALQAEQSLVVKNSAPIPHNFQINSIGPGPNQNPLIPPGGKAEVKGFVPKVIPTPYSCSIHTWMKGWVGSFSHPYFAVTDANGNFEIKNAPAGKFRLMVWQEKVGFVIVNPNDLKDRGKIITIKADEATDVGKIPLND